MDLIDTYTAIPEARARAFSLRWVNRRRDERDATPLKSLRKGERYTIRDNPIARSLENANVGIASLQYDEETDIYILPACVIQFLQLFHDGSLPDLESD